MPAFLKKLYEIRNTLRKEAEVSGNEKLFVKADEVSDQIKELSIKASRRRWESFCSEILLEKMGIRDFYSSLNKILGSKKVEVLGVRNDSGEVVNNGPEVREVEGIF